jgi:hypothetical protein
MFVKSGIFFANIGIFVRFSGVPKKQYNTIISELL